MQAKHKTLLFAQVLLDGLPTAKNKVQTITICKIFPKLAKNSVIVYQKREPILLIPQPLHFCQSMCRFKTTSESMVNVTCMSKNLHYIITQIRNSKSTPMLWTMHISNLQIPYTCREHYLDIQLFRCFPLLQTWNIKKIKLLIGQLGSLRQVLHKVSELP